MPQNITIYKFLFKATISTFDLHAQISSPLVVTWKRSNQSAVSTPVQMIAGKANINQTLTLPVNMYLDNNSKLFQQKKSIMSFNMNTPKGDKQAGVIYINLAKQLNENISILQGVYALQKCPVKNSQVKISITGECIQQKSQQNMSQSSIIMQQNNSSILSIDPQNIGAVQQKQQKSNEKQNKTQAKLQLQGKQKQIRQLQATVSKLQKQNNRLSEQLKKQKEINKQNSSLNSNTDEGKLISNLKEELLKSKSIQQKLQNQINSHRSQNADHEKQLEKTRIKMENLFELLCNHFDIDI